ncbi:MAG: hypothetical protein BGWL_c3890 [Candidatus Phytoplasma cynodontis]|nr:MAG: hypothetical protein BGWL_c3890 [Candidatus Phytoplasma cynodontis]
MRKKEPSDLLPYVKQPFFRWRTIDGGNTYNFDSATLTKASEIIVLDPYISDMHSDEREALFKFKYQGPQYLLEEDKDYYIGDANLYYSNENERFYNRKTYHLHFNPVRNTLSVYTEKFNTK